MATRRVRIFKWYIEPLDLKTNESLSRELPDEDIAKIKDSKGEPRDVYLIPPKKLSKFLNSKAGAGFRFNVLRKEGGGKIYLANSVPAIQRKRRLGLSKLAQAKTAA